MLLEGFEYPPRRLGWCATCHGEKCSPQSQCGLLSYVDRGSIQTSFEYTPMVQMGQALRMYAARMESMSKLNWDCDH